MTEQSGAKSAAEALSAAWDEMEKADEVVQEAPEGDAEEVEAPARDEKGRFRAKDEEGTSEPEKPVDVPQEPKDDPKSYTIVASGGGRAFQPPPGWSVAAKAAFDALPEPVKAAIAKREDEVSSGFKSYGEKTKAFEPLEQVIAPWRQRWATEGQNEAQAVGRLLQWQQMIEQNPQQGIALLARQYGVSFSNQSPAPQQAGSADPRLNAVMQELNALKQTLAQQQHAQSASQQRSVEAEIEAFRSDPKNKWFENVKDEMAGLLKGGAAQSLQDAYDRACWMHPEVRAQLISEQARAQEAAKRQTAQLAVQKAKAAAVSVTGAPGGSTPPNAPNPKNLRATLEAAWDGATIR